MVFLILLLLVVPSMSHGHKWVADHPEVPAVLPANVIAGYAIKAGFKQSGDAGAGGGLSEAAMITAIAFPESKARPGAHNDDASTGDDSYGLWQINMIDPYGPDRAKQFGISSYDELFYPHINAKAAYMVYQEQGFTAWTTYDKGDWRRYMAVAKFAAERPKFVGPDEDIPGIPGPDTSGPSLLDIVKGISNAISFLSDPANWIRVAGFVGGGLILLAGLVMAAKEMGVERAIPVGKVLRRVGGKNAAKAVSAVEGGAS